MNLYQRLRATVNFKFRHILRSFGKKSFRLLDVGAGNHSASRITSVFPACEYYGLDLDKNYNNTLEDFSLMKGFYEVDLTKLNYSIVPDDFFDGIWMAHVIEHLNNGDKVLPELLKKLKSGGYFYIEFPGKKSLHLPSMYGTLNFHDDPTHVRLYTWEEMKPLFEANGCRALKYGTRRNIFYMVSFPFRYILSLIKNRGKAEGNVFWDLLGFAEYLWVQKL